jgi:hypothetical protein
MASPFRRIRLARVIILRYRAISHGVISLSL